MNLEKGPAGQDNPNKVATDERPPVPPNGQQAQPNNAPPPYQQPSYGTGQPQNPQKPQWNSPVQNRSYNNDNSKLFCILSYLGILWIIGLLADRRNPDTMFHVNQGIILTILAAAIGIVDGIWSAIFTAIFSVKIWGYITYMSTGGVVLIALFNIAYAIVMLFYIIFGISNAARGIQRPLPIIGKLFTIVR